ncbi:MAG: phage tail protein [Sphingomonas sp.]|uniref:phage tail protein n=1 Tax=Sphingomonas sp. TaxID=28214 RepID=UPI002624A8A1|nr:phage tail protein [Sphingomonas sp.]MDK2766136.1 phage tail protein [Sphingomonas sp.]
MATLVLMTVGGLFGGPIGAMLGSLAGQAVDRDLLFKPKGREGPRLTELAVQTSSYGTPIPQLFGTLRVAGTVIWATDLVEHRQRERGKGRPTVTSYSYTASFAVALSARPILSVGRIWADGKLLRGAAGDWKVRTGFRLHFGGEDQAVDPLIASAEGAGSAPAHRGIAYAVFENLELEEFGNRIPALSFEVVADSGAVTAGTIVAALSGERVGAGEAVLPIEGYSGYGESVRAAIAPLIEASGAWPVVAGDRFVLASGEGGATVIADPGASGRGVERTIAAPDQVPRRVAISHYDPARDYQAGVQIATDPQGQDRERRIELPAALSAATAKGIAQAELVRAELARTQRVVRPGWSAIDVAPGARVTLAGETGQWRVVETRVEAGDVALVLTPIAPPGRSASASPGRVSPAPDRVHGATRLHGFEIPHVGEGLLSGPRLMIAACGTSPGWRRAALALSSDDGGRWEAIGGTAAPAVMGTVVATAGPASAFIEDRKSALVIDLSRSAMELTDASPDALDAGANLALVGDELIQFGRAEPMGDGRWTLTRLWRGRRGTEDAIGAMAAGDRFVLLTPDTLALQDGRGAVGGRLTVMATGVGDAEPVTVAVPMTGRSATPPAPVALHAKAVAGGRLLRWTRRSRVGWRWSDGTDSPLGESAERYQLRITVPGQPDSVVMSDAPEWLLTGADAATVAVRQAGDHGLSPPATLILDAME